jgi:putative effector of murein hydrolase LrgA (UPF0299 family)
MRAISPSAYNIENTFSILLGTDYILVFISYLIIFGVWGWFETWILNYSFDESDKQLQYTIIFTGLNLVIGIIYGKLYNDSLNGYAERPISFLNLLYDIENFSNKITYFSKINYAQDRYSNLLKNNNNLIKSEYCDVMMILTDVKDSLICICWYVYKLYNINDHYIITHRLTSQSTIEIIDILSTRTHSTHMIINEDHNYDSLKRVIFKLKNNIHMSIKKLEIMGVNGSSQTIELTSNLKPISENIKYINQSNKINIPRIFQSHILLSMFIYFLIGTPFTLWLNIGTTATIIVFPLLMLILFAPIILRKWVGEPFDKDNRVPTMDHNTWKNTTINNIIKDFDEFKQHCEQNTK